MSRLKRLEKMGEPCTAPGTGAVQSPSINPGDNQVIEGSPIFSWFNDSSYQAQHDLETGLIGSFLAVAGLAAFGTAAAPFVASAALFGAGLGMWLGRRR